MDPENVSTSTKAFRFAINRQHYFLTISPFYWERFWRLVLLYVQHKIIYRLERFINEFLWPTTRTSDIFTAFTTLDFSRIELQPSIVHVSSDVVLCIALSEGNININKPNELIMLKEVLIDAWTQKANDTNYKLCVIKRAIILRGRVKMTRSLTSKDAKLHKLTNMSLSTFGSLIKPSDISFVVLTPSERPHSMHPQFSGNTLKDHIDLAATGFSCHWVYARNRPALVATVWRCWT
ncbi:hypothetical protein CU098_010846 [Rhizopus stolonifer]|uniref:Uncharacterized protein n=1 Tax=Rhizopus stolonifer TaxID=4846 RepID=A0A367KTD0_RHIST|nr:hypothetical protein CU098_010846 [Rhizopus stolonifer]